MGKRLQRSFALLGVVLATMAAVASGTVMPGSRPPSGYTRLLTSQAPTANAQDSLVTECLMEEERLRAQSGNGGIPGRQFEELRAFCRDAARLDGEGDGIASADMSAWERATARERIRERYRQATQDITALGDAPSIPREAELSAGR
ncbi:MAG: hypothetical protein AB7U59_00900 [Desulfovibrionaceae bacterium]|jgi:hypothetical protein